MLVDTMVMPTTAAAQDNIDDQLSWGTSTLGNAVESILTGPFGSMLHQSDYVYGGIPVINPANIDGVLIHPDLNKTITKQKREELSAFILRTNDVLIGRRGDIGRCAVVSSSQAGWVCGTGCFIIRPGPRVNAEFIAQLLSSQTYRQALEALASGATMLNLGNSALQGLEIRLPPLDEQQRIAEVLRSVDEAVRAAKVAYEAARASSISLRHELLRISRDGAINAVPDEWAIRTLESLASVERGRFSVRPRNDPRYFGGDTPFVQTGDITAADDFLLQHTQTLNGLGVAVSRVFPSETILTTIAANIGDFTISTYPVAAPDSVVGIEPRDFVNTFWLYCALTCFKSALDRASTQNAQKNINLQTLRPLLVPVPPKVEMNEIAATLAAAANTMNAAKLVLQNSEAVKSLLQSDLLSGRVRVPA